MNLSKLNDVVEIVCKMIDGVNNLLQIYILSEIARCDLSVLQIAKKLLICLLTMDNIYFDDVVMHC